MKASKHSLQLLLSHLCAVAICVLVVLQWDVIVVTTSSSEPSSVECVPTAPGQKISLSVDRRPRRHYDVLPVLVLEGVPKNPIHLHKLLLNSLPRISLARKHNLKSGNSMTTTTTTDDTTSVGPFHGFYPSGKHKQWHTWLQKDASPLLKDDNFVRWEPVVNTTNRRDIWFSFSFWKRAADLADRVLILDSSAVLCGNPSSSLLDFLDYDWIGAAWKWAVDPASPLHRGGNGALSIRSPRHLMTLLSNGEDIPARGNEDMWFVNRLNRWAEKGDTRHGIPPPNLPPYGHQIRFAVEEVAPPSDIIPVGVYHLMKTMDFKDRNGLLQKCPEASILFNPLHDPRCVVLQCPKNMSIGYFDMKKIEEQEEDSVEKCNILHHPVAAVVQNWSDVEGTS
jgi:hypothetical protein